LNIKYNQWRRWLRLIFKDYQSREDERHDSVAERRLRMIRKLNRRSATESSAGLFPALKSRAKINRRCRG
jgi:hypothetical protein